MSSEEAASEHREDAHEQPKDNKKSILKEGTFRISNYEAYFTHYLRTQYEELKGDLDMYAKEVKEYFDTYLHHEEYSDLILLQRRMDALLLSSKDKLEQKKLDMLDLLAISSTLGIVRRYLIWMTPYRMVQIRIYSVISDLESLHPEGWHMYVEKLTSLSETEFTTNKLKDSALLAPLIIVNYSLGAVLDEAIGACNKKSIQNQINNGLQIERLRSLYIWGLGTFVVSLVISPLVTNLAVLREFPSFNILGGLILISAWINALGIALMGALGGFISGLLQARSTRITLQEYQENRLKLQIKPLLGAIMSLVLYVLLSWQILPGITIVNTGSYFFIAFLSGFSERYFLKLLELKTEKEGPNEAPKELKSESDAGAKYTKSKHKVDDKNKEIN